MQWAANELPTNWFYTSINENTVVNLTKMVSYFNTIMKEKYTFSDGTINFSSMPIICEYSYQDKDSPNRNTASKGNIPQKNYPGKFWPIYCNGGTYSTSSDMIKNLFQVSRRTLRLPIHLHEIWVTGFLRLKVKKTNDNIVVSFVFSRL